jgi:hypothetical protein
MFSFGNKKPNPAPKAKSTAPQAAGGKNKNLAQVQSVLNEIVMIFPRDLKLCCALVWISRHGISN